MNKEVEVNNKTYARIRVWAFACEWHQPPDPHFVSESSSSLFFCGTAPSGQFAVGLVQTPMRSSTICWVSRLLSSLWKCQFLSHVKFMRDLIFLFPWILPIPAPAPNRCFDYSTMMRLISGRTLPFQMFRLLSVLIFLDQLLFYFTDILNWFNCTFQWH